MLLYVFNISRKTMSVLTLLLVSLVEYVSAYDKGGSLLEGLGSSGVVNGDTLIGVAVRVSVVLMELSAVVGGINTGEF